MSINFYDHSITTSGTITCPSGNFTTLTINGTSINNFNENIDDRVNSLLVAGTGINLSYNDNSNALTINLASSAVSGYEILTSNKSIFTVSQGYLSNNLNVYVNGSKLILGEDYTASNGSTFTLSQTAASGDIVEWQGLGGPAAYAELNHTHSSSDITNFNSSVSGLLPTIANSGDNRILTSTGSSVGINAESNLTFDGNLLNVIGSGSFSSQTVFASGTAAAPGISILGDTDTGLCQISSVGTNSLSISTSGVERVRFAFNGDVQINTGRTISGGTGGALFGNNGINNDFISTGRAAALSAGWATLRVNQVAAYVGLRLVGDTSQTASYMEVENSSGTNLFTINSAGNVGIGVTSPQSKLSVVNGSDNTTTSLALKEAYIVGPNNTLASGAGNLQISTNDSASVDFGGMITFGGRYSTQGDARTIPWGVIKGAKENSTNGSGLGYLVFGTNDNSNIVERMRITSAGSVGIGTSSPQQKFVVSNAGAEGMEIIPALNSNESRIQTYNRSTSAWNKFSINCSTFELFTNGATTTIFGNASGNVGIGSTSPQTALQISKNADGALLILSGAQSANTQSILFRNPYHTNNSTAGTAFIGAQDTGSQGGNLIFATTSNNSGTSGIPTERMRIKSDGDIVLTNNKILADDSTTTNSVVYSFDGDTNTGIGRSGADAMTFITGGSTRATIDDAGQFLYNGRIVVRNGTTVGANDTIYVGPNDGALGRDSQIVLGCTFSNGWGGADYGTRFAGAIRFGANGGSADPRDWSMRFLVANGPAGSDTPRECMRITAAGRVGIGTSSPAELLHVRGAGARAYIYNTTTDAVVIIQGLTPASPWLGAGKSAVQIDVDGWGGFAWQTDVTSGAKLFKLINNGGYGASESTFITVNNSGKVGIGVTTNLTAALNFPQADSGEVINYYPSETEGVRSGVGKYSAEVRHYVPAGDVFTWRTGGPSGTERMKLSASLLTVGSSVSITASQVYSDIVGATNRDLFVDSTGKFGYVSSIRASKTNITAIDDVSWLRDLTPVSFFYRRRNEDGTYSDEPDGTLDYGLIAEDVEVVAPELCFYDIIDDNPELRGVHYSKLITPMLKYIQQLEDRIVSLETRLGDNV